MPSAEKFSTVAAPKRSAPTRATIATSAPQRRAATAWFAPLPPKPRSNRVPNIVSPGDGNAIDERRQVDVAAADDDDAGGSGHRRARLPTRSTNRRMNRASSMSY